MTVAARLLLFAPVLAAAALAAESLAPPRHSLFSRWVPAAGMAAAFGGALALVIGLSGGETVEGRGFEFDVLRAGLAAGMAVVALATVSLTPLRWGTGAALLAATASGVGALASQDVPAVAGFLVTTTLALGAAALSTGREPALAFVRYAIADVAIVVGLLLAAGDGLRVPPSPDGFAAALVMVGAGLKAGVLPLGRWFARAIEADRAVASILSGAGLAQAVLLVGWGAASGGRVADATVLVASVAGAWFARRAVREAAAVDAVRAQTALAIAGIAMGSAAAGRGAALLVGASFLASALVMLGATKGLGSLSIGAAPLGAALPGGAMIVSSLFSRAAVERWSLLAAAAASMALVWLAQAGVAGMRAPAWRTNIRPQRARSLSVAPLLACLAIAAIPASALAHAGRAAEGFSGVRSLGDIGASLTDGAGLAALAIGVIAWLALGSSARGPERAGITIEEAPSVVVSRLWLVGTGIGAVTIVLVVVLVRVGMTRGFL